MLHGVDQGGAWAILKESGAIPASTAPRKMKKLSAGLEAIADLIVSCEAVKKALEDLRDCTTDDEWEEIISNPLVDTLVSTCMDLEDRLQ
jgi:hypothetical protein